MIRFMGRLRSSGAICLSAGRIIFGRFGGSETVRSSAVGVPTRREPYLRYKVVARFIPEAHARAVEANPNLIPMNSSNRRTFIQQTAAAVATTSAFGLPSPARAAGANERVTVGLIGPG